MTRETKVGLMMVALLVGVFGFLLYKRIHQPLEGLATQESSEELTAELDHPTEQHVALPQREEVDSLTFERPRTRKSDRKAALKSSAAGEFASKLPDDEADFSEQVADQQKLKPPEISRSEEDEFDQFVERPTPEKKAAPRELTIEPADNAFDDFSSSRGKNHRTITQVAASSDSDPFGGNNSEAEASESEASFSEAETSTRTLPAPAALNEEMDANESQFESEEQAVPLNLKQPRRMEPLPKEGASGRYPTESKSGPKDRTTAVRQTGEFDNGLVPAPREERRADPVTFDDRSFSPEGSPRGSLGGPSYVIEPNDNFWSISRKRYGVGRYYLALARHNEEVIPDPKRMKPGVAIATPDAALLEQRYPDLIPKPATAEPAPAVVTTQSRKTENAVPAGFFVSVDGVPMYRVTGQDTLSEIAKSHLGRSSRWVQILEMNRKVLRDGNELKIGTVLQLPADASRVQVVGTPREFR